MKIRGKIVILELLIASLLFLSLFIAIGNFWTISSFEDIKLKYKASMMALDDVIYSFDILLNSPTPFAENLEQIDLTSDNYTQTNTELKISIKKTRMPKLYQNDLLQQENNELVRILSNEEVQRVNEYYQTLVELDNQGLLADQSLTAVVNLMEYNDIDYGEFYTTITNFINGFELKKREIEAYREQLDRNYEKTIGEFQEMRRKNLIMIFINLGFFLFFVIMLALLFSGNMSRKIKKIDKAFEVVASGDFSSRLSMTSDDEFGTLARNFNSLVDSLWTKLESMRQIMHDVGESISNEIDLSKVESSIVYLAKKNTTADGVALFKIVGEDKMLRLQYASGDYRPPFNHAILEKAESSDLADLVALLKQAPLPLKGNIIGESALQAKAQFIRNVGLSRPEIKRGNENPLYVSSTIAIPLRIGNKVLGVLSLVKTKGFDYFSDLEYSNMQSFAELSAITIDNLNKYSEMLEAFELNREIGIASEIQQNLLPGRFPVIPNYEIGYFYKPLKGINGDFFDIIPLGYDKVLLSVCEVAGKGVPAALVMVMIRTILRLIAHPDKTAGELLTELNQNITERVQIENFASMGILIMNKKNNTLTYASASHHPLQIYRSADETFQEIESGGIPVGIDFDSKYPTVELEANENDLLIIYTDGITETRNRAGAEYGTESLLEMVSNNKESDTETIVNTIQEDLEYFEKGSKLYDDKTLFILKYTGLADET